MTQRQFEIMVDFITNHKESANKKVTCYTQKEKEFWCGSTNPLSVDRCGPIKKAEKWRKVRRFLIVYIF